MLAAKRSQLVDGTKFAAGRSRQPEGLARAVLGAATFAIGHALEGLGLHVVASFAFVPTCLAAPVLAIAAATWWLLRGSQTNYVKGSPR